MRLVRCPCGCGHVFDADAPRVRVWQDERLSEDARALLDNAPRHWKRGQRASIRLLADCGGMSYWRAREVLQDLCELGYATTTPYGKKGRVQYLGVVTMIRAVEEALAA